MTKQEWLAATDPMPMLEFLRSRASDRKLRLFAVACCYRIWARLTAERSRAAVDLAEQFAEGLVTPRERREMYRVGRSDSDASAPDEAAVETLHRLPYIAASGAAAWSSIAVGA